VKGLAGRGVLVSGGTRGIGRATAQRFVEEGCRVFVTGLEPDDLAETLDRLRPSARGLGGCVADVRDHDNATAVVERAEADIGPLDVLANNAGSTRRAPFLELDAATWDATIAVNLRGMFSMAQAFARLLVRTGRHGAVVNMASTNALAGEEDYAHYNAAKGGVLQLTRTMAVELGVHGIRVNCLCPGYIDTPLNRQIAEGLPDGFVADYVKQRIPLGRVGTPEDVAAAYAFLASDDAAFVHGVAFVVDGGQLAVM
jgi:NAD(P)-dependent dehydrogenase (short-subunit alcohol dehydrogenase family)